MRKWPIETADANEQVSPAPTDIHLYANDANATFDRAPEAGATSIGQPGDHPSGDRWGALKAHKMIPFMEAAFGAEAGRP